MSKTILITGSSSGIGKATAKYFQSKGWSVAATMRNPEKETELIGLSNVLVLKLDVTDIASIQSAIKETIEKFGGIDTVLNNAGYGLTGAFEAASQEEIQKQFDTNVFGSMNVMREIIPYFREKKTGTIIQITSMGGKMALPFYSLYHSTKWAMEGFTDSLWYELRKFNIKVKIVEPGPINTDFYGRSLHIAKKEGLNVYDKYQRRVLEGNKSAVDFYIPPIAVAKTIFRAANDRSYKLRYQTDLMGGMVLFFRWILPDSVFSFIMGKGLGV